MVREDKVRAFVLGFIKQETQSWSRQAAESLAGAKALQRRPYEFATWMERKNGFIQYSCRVLGVMRQRLVINPRGDDQFLTMR